jgi:hypothetical protein
MYATGMRSFLVVTSLAISCVCDSTVEIVHGLRSRSSNDNKNGRELRELQWFSEPICGVIGFSIYNSSSMKWNTLAMDGYMSDRPESRILLDTYPGGKINIQAVTDTSGCIGKPTIIRCVKLTLGNYTTSTERTAPYTLYKNEPMTNKITTTRPPKTGFQTLIARAYTSINCTGPELNNLQTDVHLVPETTKAVRAFPIIASYNGLTAIPKPGQTLPLVNATCKYIKDALGFGFTYKGSLSLVYDEFRCWQSTANTTTSINPTITYHIIPTFTISSQISPYLNQDMPTTDSVTNYIKGLFRDQIGLGPGAEDEMMSTSVKPTLALRNPYKTYTTITV